MAVRLTLDSASSVGVASLLTCACSEVIIKSTGAGGKVRSKTILLTAEGVYAVCKGCDAEVRLPLTWTKTAAPELVAGPELFLDK